MNHLMFSFEKDHWFPPCGGMVRSLNNKDGLDQHRAFALKGRTLTRAQGFAERRDVNHREGKHTHSGNEKLLDVSRGGVPIYNSSVFCCME